MSVHTLRISIVGLALIALPSCISVVSSNERALFSSTGGVQKKPVGPGWYFRLPWNHYKTYDLRWKQHEEEIDVTTKDGLHIRSTITVVARPQPDELYDLDLDAGPDYYAQLIRPALYASARDAGAKFDHREASKQTRDVETAIKTGLVQRLIGHHVEIDEVALKHFDLPGEVVQAANRTAASEQLLAAKQVDLDLAQKDAEIAKAQRRGKLEADGLEKQMRAEQELAAAEEQLKIEEAKRKSERQRHEADADAIVIKADAEAKAVLLAAEAEKKRIEATSARLTPSYIRLQAIDALARAMSGQNTKLVVMPTGKNGLPAFFSPFLNPLGNFDTTAEPAP